MTLHAGDAFWMDDPGGGHLYFVLSDPQADPAHVVIANATSWTPNKDQSCIIEPGDHPALPNRSCIHYGLALLIHEGDVPILLAEKKLSPRQPASPALLARMQQGAQTSAMPTDQKKLLRVQGIIT